ncbi:MAG TPA: nuclear transport factor 2 family protein [Solirubrobacter sp.]|nr:nuclear transport factor 2 family protein [Solirubrobacter sp.]
MTAPTAPTLDVDALRSASDALEAIASLLADDVEWIEVDEGSRPAAPSVLRGREAVLAMLRDAAARGIVSRVVDGFAAGDRAAMTVRCAMPAGGEVVSNALVELRDGNIARYFGVQAWDD